MKAVAFPQANKVLIAPHGPGEVLDPPVWGGEVDGVQRCISCWEPTEEERALIAGGGPVWLWARGHTHPPITLDAANPFETTPPPPETVGQSFRDALARLTLTPEEEMAVRNARIGASSEVASLLVIIDRLTGAGS